MSLMYYGSALIICFVDQFTKSWAAVLSEPKLNGIFNFVLHFNKGIIFGYFSEVPQTVMACTLLSGAFFLFILFLKIHVLLPAEVEGVRPALSLVAGGVMGNVTDRAVHGYVTDFIIVRVGHVMSPAFNVADISLCLGAILAIAFLCCQQNQRRNPWQDTSILS